MRLLTQMKRAFASRRHASERDAPDLSDAGSRDGFVGRAGSDETGDVEESGAERRAAED